MSREADRPVSLRFAAAVRVLGEAARALELVVPGFRSPPGIAGRKRTLRRNADGSVTVSLVIRNRPWAAVQADLIQGVVRANGLEAAAAEAVTDDLWAALARSEAGSVAA